MALLTRVLLEKGRKVIGWQGKQPILAPHAPVHLENAWFFLLPEARIHASEVPLDEQWKKIENGWVALCDDLSAGRLPLAEEEKGNVQVVDVNADKYPKVAEEFSLTKVPTIFIYTEGIRLRTFEGAHDATTLKAMLDQLLSSGN